MTKWHFPAKALSLGSLLLALMPAASLAEHATIPVAPLATYGKLDPAGVTVSDISSGAFFAHQFHFAYSGLVKGAVMVAGGLYACAEQVDDVVPPHAFTSMPAPASPALLVHHDGADVTARPPVLSVRSFRGVNRDAPAVDRLSSELRRPVSLVLLV